MLHDTGQGAYLVRASKRSADAYTLCFLFDGNVMNYKLYYAEGMHFVAEKRFETLYSLVADGLIALFVEKHASDYIKKMADEAVYEHSPYSMYNKSNELLNQSRASPLQQCHSFTPFTFKIPQYCDLCKNFLWGLVQQGVRCQNCGYSAHRKCSERVKKDCYPNSKYVKRMFGIDLITLCMAHNVEVPPVLTLCIDEINRRGLHMEGIYRVSGSHDQMDKLRKQFDACHPVNLEQEDIHNVCGLLKLYLRLLPQQLVPFMVFQNLLKAYNSSRNTREKTLRCQQALDELHEYNLYTLQVLLDHLRLVAEHSNYNKMTTENICTIFSPTIFCTGVVPSLPQQQHVLLHFLMTTAVFPHQAPRALDRH
ncbi:SH2 motif and Protein kinase C and RhoGAP domain containing protein [Aphelenchoides bicaudatus]|nr:SH2 motif and Protein kinase C and RhoGAP domain containing protein [Aphelenchoides bicaudatus]